MKTPHILIIRFSAIGDVAMLVPVVSSLAKQYPNLRITVLSRPFARPFFENLADNVGFMGADLKEEYKGISGLNALYRRLQAKHFTHIADMHGVLRSHYLRFRFVLSNYKVAHIDKHRKEKRALVNEDKSNFHQLSTSFRNYADVLEKLGYLITPDFRSIYGEGRGNLRLLSDKIGEKKSFTKWIGIAPFAAHKGKIYPLEKMEQVVQMIIKAHPSCRAGHIPFPWQRRRSYKDGRMAEKISTGHICNFYFKGYEPRTYPHVTSKCDDINGFRQYAPRISRSLSCC